MKTSIFRVPSVRVIIRWMLFSIVFFTALTFVAFLRVSKSTKSSSSMSFPVERSFPKGDDISFKKESVPQEDSTKQSTRLTEDLTCLKLL